MTQNRKESRQRPGGKGSGSSSKKPTKPTTLSSKSQETVPEDQQISIELQQLLLNIFKNVFSATLTSDSLKPTLQEVKQALFDRDFERAFGREDYLEAYTVRWSPSRTLCYANILLGLRQYLSYFQIFNSLAKEIAGSDASELSRDQYSTMNKSNEEETRFICLGGGAAEVVAMGGIVRYLFQEDKSVPPATESEESQVSQAIDSLAFEDRTTSNKMNVILVDTAAWGAMVNKLTEGLMSSPTLSKYANAATKAANAPFLPPRSLTTTFQQDDLLEVGKETFLELVGPSPSIITLLFTLNELYTTSITKTTTFLLNLTAAVPKETILLVVDSPGSYSETTVGKEQKKYPMQWLMDHTLLENHSKRGEEDSPSWEKLVSNDSRWFRLAEELKYPIQLENMRYQVHLFKRL